MIIYDFIQTICKAKNTKPTVYATYKAKNIRTLVFHFYCINIDRLPAVAYCATHTKKDTV